MRGTCAAALAPWADHDPAAAPGDQAAGVDLDPAAKWISTTPPLKLGGTPVSIALADVIDATMVSSFAAAQRSDDLAQRAEAARRTHAAVARRLDELRRKRAEFEARAEQLRSKRTLDAAASTLAGEHVGAPPSP